jgi:hypothetical protein
MLFSCKYAQYPELDSSPTGRTISLGAFGNVTMRHGGFIKQRTTPDDGYLPE